MNAARDNYAAFQRGGGGRLQEEAERILDGAGSFPQDKMLVFSPAVAGLKMGGGWFL